MSLRTKLMLSIFAFMVLALGLLTLILWLEAAQRTRTEVRHTSNLMVRLANDYLNHAAPADRIWTPSEWDRLSRWLDRSDLISEWAILGLKGGNLRVVLSSDPDLQKVLRQDAPRLAEAFAEQRVEADGTRIHLPIPSAGDERYAARLDLRGSAVPASNMGDAITGIATVMALGTAILLLNGYVFINRFVLRPLGTLVEASNRVARGDFSKKIPEGQTYDEMGRMVRAFNLMIDKIADHNRALQGDIRKARLRVADTERKLFAAQRLSTTGTLAAGIAHEINNPLGGMVNAARSLKEGRLEEAKRAEYLDLILDGLERVHGIVQKILQFRPRPFEPRPVRLREAMEQAIAFLHHRSRAKGVEIRNELPPDLPPVQGDPLELQQAFLNVLMNAVDACVMGEGRVTIRHQGTQEAVSVSVADNGCGMDEEEVARCMDPFFTTKDVGEGTGLGLAVAHNIVTNHGGRIDATSRPGQGTTFTLTFPVLRGRTASSQPRDS